MAVTPSHGVKPTSSRDKQWLQVPFHAGLFAQLNLWSRRVHLSKGGFEERRISSSGNRAMSKLDCREGTVERTVEIAPSSWTSGMERDAEQWREI